MGSFRVPMRIADAEGRRSEEVLALVDTGATYTWVPRDLLEGLGIQPEEERPFVLAEFLLAPDPIHRRLVPVPGLLKRWQTV